MDQSRKRWFEIGKSKKKEEDEKVESPVEEPKQDASPEQAAETEEAPKAVDAEEPVATEEAPVEEAPALDDSLEEPAFVSDAPQSTEEEVGSAFLEGGASDVEEVEESPYVNLEATESTEEKVPAYASEQSAKLEELTNGMNETLDELSSEVTTVKYMLGELITRTQQQMPDLTKFMTTHDQLKSVNSAIEKVSIPSSNKALVRAMEQVSTMREDFFKLIKDMKPRVAEMDPEVVLSSFEAYVVDMENILTDAHVYIGKFDFDRINTLHQRIVGVVPTDDKEKDGTVAESLSDGYKLGDKVLVKERVSVFKYEHRLEPDNGEEAEAESTGTADVADPEPVVEPPAAKTTSNKKKTRGQSKGREEQEEYE